MESELKLTSQNRPPALERLTPPIFFFWPTHKVKLKISTWDRVSRKCLLESTGVLYLWQGLAVATLELAYHFFPMPQNIVKFAIIYRQLNKFNLQEWHFLCSSLIYTSFNTENGREFKNKSIWERADVLWKLSKKYLFSLLSLKTVSVSFYNSDKLSFLWKVLFLLATFENLHQEIHRTTSLLAFTAIERNVDVDLSKVVNNFNSSQKRRVHFV